MVHLSRRDVVIGAFGRSGVDRPLAIANAAQARPMPEAAWGFYGCQVATLDVTALYDGV